MIRRAQGPATRGLILAALLVLVVSACGGGNESPVETAEDEFETFCAAAVDAGQIAAQTDGGGPELNAALRQFEDAAPEDIAEEVATVVRLVRKGTQTDSPEFREPSEVIDRFLFDNCGFEQVRVTAVEYEFQGVPETLPPGPVAFDFVNDGSQVHQMLLVKFDEGVDLSVEELIELGPKKANKLVTQVGEMFGLPGESDARVFDLETGRYGFACFVPKGAKNYEDLERSKAPPHLTLGMFGEFTVSG